MREWSERHTQDPQAKWNKPRKPKARRDRARWCRGKPGVEHAYKLAIPVNAYSFNRPPCRRVKTYRRDGGVTVVDGVAWTCGHAMVCENCGRNLHTRKGEDCPDRPAEIRMARWPW